MLPFLLLAFASVPAPARAFDLVRQYQGSTFFDNWDFYGYWDNLTSGDVEYVNRADAFSNELVQFPASGSVTVRVDNFTNVPFNYKRNSIRITTQDYYDFGSVWVFDIKHLPYGCSVWPSIWTHGDDWPNGGEIDIIEGINLQARNQVAVHTISGCTKQGGTNELGWAGSPNCSIPAGCTVQDPDTRSYGAPFAAAGGGVWATQYDVAGIFIWFWTRDNVPAAISSGSTSLDISQWGPPLAAYPSSTCNMTKFFTPQKIVIDITLCGVWAGVPSIYNATCRNSGGKTGLCYNDNVIGPGSPHYDEAYFEINAIRAYTTNAAGPSQTSTTAVTTPTTPTTPTTSDTTTTTPAPDSPPTSSIVFPNAPGGGGSGSAATRASVAAPCLALVFLSLAVVAGSI